ncbi:hypothetical protein MRX96_057151 [Rhipicephalus microplus]
MFRGAGKHEPATPRLRCSRSVSPEQCRGTTSSRTICPWLTDDVARLSPHGTFTVMESSPVKTSARPRRPLCPTPAASSCLPEEQGELLKALLYGRWISWGGKRPPPAVEATILSTVSPGKPSKSVHLCQEQRVASRSRAEDSHIVHVSTTA